MKLVYHNDWRGNFGDDLNPPFFKAVFPEHQSSRSNRKLYGIGTLLNNNSGETLRDAVIFGSGFGYANQVDWDRKSTSVIGVRGPLTARAMGLDPKDSVIGDPAIYAVEMPEFKHGNTLTNSRRVVCLHHRTCELWNFQAKNSSQLYFLDPGMSSLQDYIATIREAEIVYAESLHGAIVAATLGVPWIPVWIREPLESVKWADFFELMKYKHFEPIRLEAPPSSFVRRLAISSKARHLFEPSHLGRIVYEEHILNIQNTLYKEHPSSFLRTDKTLISSLQEKIHEAIGKLQKVQEIQ